MTETRVARHVLFQFSIFFLVCIVVQFENFIFFCVACTCLSHKIISRTLRPIQSDGTLCDKGTCTIVITIENNTPFYLVPFIFFCQLNETNKVASTVIIFVHRWESYD